MVAGSATSADSGDGYMHAILAICMKLSIHNESVAILRNFFYSVTAIVHGIGAEAMA